MSVSGERERRTGLLRYVDTWRFAAGIAFLAIVAMGLWNLSISSDLQRAVSRLDSLVAERTAEAQRGNEEQVRTCVNTAVRAPILQRLLNELARTLESPQAREDALNFARVNQRNAITLADCRELASTLGVTTVRVPRASP